MCVTLRIRIVMYGVCTSCVGAETLKVLIQNFLDDMSMEYKQWVVTDRATLMTVTVCCVWDTWTEWSSSHCQIKDRIFETVKREPTIRSMHSFGRLLRELFIYTPRCCTGLSLGKQSSFHNVVVYIKDHHLQTLSFCVISGRLDHNTSSFYAFKRTLVHLCTK
jgi:hypothetical protein